MILELNNCSLSGLNINYYKRRLNFTFEHISETNRKFHAGRKESFQNSEGIMAGPGYLFTSTTIAIPVQESIRDFSRTSHEFKFRELVLCSHMFINH